MNKHMTQEVAIKSAWMILEGLGFSREINGDLEKTVTAVFESAPAADVVEVRHEPYMALSTVEVVAVRHGRWLRTPTGWVYCSVCGEEPPEETNARTKYCPNCGARCDL